MTYKRWGIANIFLISVLLSAPPASAETIQPNIVVIMTDDVAPMDLSFYHRGLGAVETPHIDSLARDGMMLADYYAQPSCTAGRAAFMTGQYPIRTGLTSVGQPGSPVGLSAEDPTIAQLLKPLGYATAQFGKNHFGDRNEFLPTLHGFDEYYGWLYHLNMMEMPEQPEFPQGPNFVGRPRNMVHSWASSVDDPSEEPRWGRVGRQRIEDAGPLTIERMKTIDNEITKMSIGWIKKQKDSGKPFFLFYNLSRMHQVTHVGAPWRGKSGHGEYADGLLQLDYEIGQLLEAIDNEGLRSNTIVVFTSDNGVNLAHWPDSGSASFRGEKGETWDGAYRVPAVVRWPGRIPAGTYARGFMTSEDWLPTLLAAAGDPNVKRELLKGKAIDGQMFKVHLDGYDQMAMLADPIAPSQRHEFFYYAETQLTGVRVDQWKVSFAVKDNWIDAARKIPGGMLVDIKLDPYERSVDAPRHLQWETERTWVLPLIMPYVGAYMASLKSFPPRQKGTGIGVSEAMSQFQKGSGE